MTIRPAPHSTRRCPALRRTHARRMHWYVRQRSENGRRGDYRHWVWVLNQGPLVSTTIVFRLEHMLAARMSPTVTSSTLKVPSPERRMTPHFCNQSRLPSTTSYRRLMGHDNTLKPRASTDPTRQQAGFVDRTRRINFERRSSWLDHGFADRCRRCLSRPSRSRVVQRCGVSEAGRHVDVLLRCGSGHSSRHRRLRRKLG